MSGYITIEINGGTAIESAADDAQRIADLLGINCEFKFNDVKCIAAPGGSRGLLAHRQQFEQSRKLERPMDWRFASSSPHVKHAADEAKP